MKLELHFGFITFHPSSAIFGSLFLHLLFAIRASERSSLERRREKKKREKVISFSGKNYQSAERACDNQSALDVIREKQSDNYVTSIEIKELTASVVCSAITTTNSSDDSLLAKPPVSAEN